MIESAASRNTLVVVLARWALLLSIVLLPVTKNVHLPIVGPRLTVFEPAALLVIALWALARGWRTLPFAGAATRGADIALATFLCAAAASGLMLARYLGTGGALVSFGVELATFVYLAIFFLAARSLLADAGTTTAALRAWTVGALVVVAGGLIGTAELFVCDTPLSGLVIWNARLVSTFRNPNQLAAYLVPTLLVFAAVWLAARDRPAWRAGVVVVLCAGLVVLLFSGSRGGLLAFPTGAVLLLVALRFSRRAILAYSLGAGLLVSGAAAAILAADDGNPCLLHLSNTVESLTFQLPAALRSARELDRSATQATASGETGPDRDADGESKRRWPWGLGRFPSRGEDAPGFEPPAIVPFGGDTGSAVAFRTVVARHALALWQASPVVGVGVGTMHLYVRELTGGQASVSAHNTPLTLLAETGVVGAVAFFAAIGLLMWTGLSAWRTGDPVRSALALGLLVGVVALLVMGISFDAQRQRVLWLMLAWLAALRAHDAPRQHPAARQVA